MPSLQKHLDKFNHNKSLISSSFFDLDNTQYLDWVVTIVFYSAVHLVEKELAAFNVTTHSKSHVERERNILKIAKFKHIYTQYHSLYNQSIRSRYDCCKFSKPEVQAIIDLLQDIEGKIS